MSTLLPFVAALGVVIALQRMLGTVIPADSDLFRFFRPTEGWFLEVVPAFIVFGLTWTFTDLLLRGWRVRRTDRDLRRPEIRQLPDIVGEEPFRQTLQRLGSSGRGLLDRRVGRRVAWLLHHLEGVDARRGHELLRHRSDLDSRSAAAGYRTVRILGWTMPIAGVVGTVLAIGLAVGGFSESLSATVGDDTAGVVTVGLAELMSGVSVALGTTLLGLLAGLVAGVTCFAVQAREGRTLRALDELSLEIIASVPAAAGRTRGGAGPLEGTGGGDLDRLEAQTERLIAAIEAGIEGLTYAIVDMRIGVTGLGDRVRQIEDANQTLAVSLSELGEGLESFRDAQTALTPVLRRLSGPLELKLTSSDGPEASWAVGPKASRIHRDEASEGDSGPGERAEPDDLPGERRRADRRADRGADQPADEGGGRSDWKDL